MLLMDCQLIQRRKQMKNPNGNLRQEYYNMSWDKMNEDVNKQDKSSEPQQDYDIYNYLRKPAITSKDRGLNICIYGKPGTGKTHFSLTAPAPIIILDTENASDF